MSTHRLPQQYHHNRYVFHCADPANVESILDAGIEHTRPPGPDTQDAADVINSLASDTHFPFDRTNVVYCYTTPTYVAKTLRDREHHSDFFDDVVLVIDTTKINAPMYLADMSTVSDLLDYYYVDASIMIRYDTPTEALAAYDDSIQRVTSPADIAAYDSGIVGGLPELIVDGTVPADAVVDVI